MQNVVRPNCLQSTCQDYREGLQHFLTGKVGSMCTVHTIFYFCKCVHAHFAKFENIPTAYLLPKIL